MSAKLCQFVAAVLLVAAVGCGSDKTSPGKSTEASVKMKIRDIRIEDIRLGKNWRLLNRDENIQAKVQLQDRDIEECKAFQSHDYIVYSALFVTKAGVVTPCVLIKVVKDIDPGGDYCEYANGKWQQVGLVPNPNAPETDEYIANPLAEDPSFVADHDFRKEHRDNFKKWVSQIPK